MTALIYKVPRYPIVAMPWEYSQCSKLCVLAEVPDEATEHEPDIDNAATSLYEFLVDYTILSIRVYQNAVMSFSRLFQFDTCLGKVPGAQNVS